MRIIPRWLRCESCSAPAVLLGKFRGPQGQRLCPECCAMINKAYSEHERRMRLKRQAETWRLQAWIIKQRREILSEKNKAMAKAVTEGVLEALAIPREQGRPT